MGRVNVKNEGLGRSECGKVKVRSEGWWGKK